MADAAEIVEKGASLSFQLVVLGSCVGMVKREVPTVALLAVRHYPYFSAHTELDPNVGSVAAIEWTTTTPSAEATRHLLVRQVRFVDTAGDDDGIFHGRSDLSCFGVLHDLDWFVVLSSVKK